MKNFCDENKNPNKKLNFIEDSNLLDIIIQEVTHSITSMILF